MLKRNPERTVITIIFVYKDWTFWSVSIPQLFQLVPPFLPWSTYISFFLVGDDPTASEEFGQVAFLKMC
jgi:hypothetical protein